MFCFKGVLKIKVISIPTVVKMYLISSIGENIRMNFVAFKHVLFKFSNVKF